MSSVAEGGPQASLRCSFCGKSEQSVRKLVAGPRVFICDECVELCMVIVRDGNSSFYLRSPDEYRRLAADDVRSAEAAGMSADKALLAVGRTWLRLAEESEKARESDSEAKEGQSKPAAEARPGPSAVAEAVQGEPVAKAELSESGSDTEPSQPSANAEPGLPATRKEPIEAEAQSEPIDPMQILTSLANLASPLK